MPGSFGQTAKRRKIAFRYFVPDFEANLETAIADAVESKRELTADPGANGFQANPNLFRTRWAVGVPAHALELVRGSRLKLHLTQTQEINDKPALVRRVRLSASGDASWHELVDDVQFVEQACTTHKIDSPVSKDSEC